MIKISDLEKYAGVTRNTFRSKINRDERYKMEDGAISIDQAKKMLREYSNKERYQHLMLDKLAESITAELPLSDTPVEQVTAELPLSDTPVEQVTAELPLSNFVIRFLQGDIWKGLLSLMAIIGSTVLIYHFLDKAVNIVPTGIKWMEAALVSMIGLTMSASNRDKKWVISSEKGTKDSRYHVPERSVSHATMWLVCFFVIESLAGLCLVDIIISPVVESTIGVLLFPIATLSFIHTFVK